MHFRIWSLKRLAWENNLRPICENRVIFPGGLLSGRMRKCIFPGRPLRDPLTSLTFPISSLSASSKFSKSHSYHSHLSFFTASPSLHIHFSPRSFSNFSPPLPLPTRAGGGGLGWWQEWWWRHRWGMRWARAATGSALDHANPVVSPPPLPWLLLSWQLAGAMLRIRRPWIRPGWIKWRKARATAGVAQSMRAAAGLASDCANPAFSPPPLPWFLLSWWPVCVGSSAAAKEWGRRGRWARVSSFYFWDIYIYILYFFLQIFVFVWGRHKHHIR